MKLQLISIQNDEKQENDKIYQSITPINCSKMNKRSQISSAKKKEKKNPEAKITTRSRINQIKFRLFEKKYSKREFVRGNFRICLEP